LRSGKCPEDGCEVENTLKMVAKWKIP